jgi:tRNA dimethylallyltransferase
MHERHELPIIVGGTSYWIQHLIFPNRLTPKDTSHAEVAHASSWSQELKDSIASLPPDLLTLLTDLPSEAPSAKLDPDKAFSLHALLSALDPVIAKRWHWKDTRKVLRNLEILKESRKRPSDVILEQSKNTTDSRPRYKSLLSNLLPYSCCCCQISCAMLLVVR